MAKGKKLDLYKRLNTLNIYLIFDLDGRIAAKLILFATATQRYVDFRDYTNPELPIVNAIVPNTTPLQQSLYGIRFNNETIPQNWFAFFKNKGFSIISVFNGQALETETIPQFNQSFHNSED